MKKMIICASIIIINGTCLASPQKDSILTSHSENDSAVSSKKEMFNKKYQEMYGEKPSQKIWSQLEGKCNSTGGCNVNT